MTMGCDYLTLTTSRKAVEAMDLSDLREPLQELLSSPSSARYFQGRIGLSFSGFDETPESLWEIPAFREYMVALDDEFPYWLFFLDQQSRSIVPVWMSFVLPYLTREARASRYPGEVEQLMVKRWIPALNAVSEFACLDSEELQSVSDAAIAHVFATMWAAIKH